MSQNQALVEKGGEKHWSEEGKGREGLSCRSESALRKNDVI
ncbi:MAG TPA: hypothetical protein VK133_03645 [Amoebophilaceae bacterium]|nr:hypothetical protein [Amoebophilaceae bacterium]